MTKTVEQLFKKWIISEDCVNSPGPWPRALKIIGTLSLSYQVTLVTCWAGRGGSLKLVPCTIPALSHLVLVPLFSIFWPLKKSWKNGPLKKLLFRSISRTFGIFSVILSWFLVHLGTIRRYFFDLFGWSNFQLFFHRFFKEKEKWKNIKSTF